MAGFAPIAGLPFLDGNWFRSGSNGELVVLGGYNELKGSAACVVSE